MLSGMHMLKTVLTRPHDRYIQSSRCLPCRKCSSKGLGLTRMDPFLSIITLWPGCLYRRPNFPIRGTMSVLFTICHVLGHTELYSLQHKL